MEGIIENNIDNQNGLLDIKLTIYFFKSPCAYCEVVILENKNHVYNWMKQV